MKIKHATSIEDFLAGLPEATREELEDLHGERNERVVEIDGLGKVQVWLGECSEGADRGGYVSFAKLLDVEGPDGQPVTLEQDTGDSGWLFEGRYGKCFDWRCT